MKERFLRIFDSNIEMYENLSYGLKKIKGIGLRVSQSIRKSLNLNSRFRVLQLNSEIIEKISGVLVNPTKYGIPLWMLNKRRDLKTGESLHIISSILQSSLRDDIERLIKSRSNRGLRHLRKLKTRGQHTKSKGRKGKTIGVVRKKKK